MTMNPCQRSPTDPVSSRARGRAAIRRGLVVDAASLLFAERGFHGAGMAEIAARSGVATNQIYRDFADKDAIIMAAAERVLDTLWAGIGPMQQRDKRPAIHDWFAEVVAASAIQDHRLISEALAESSRRPRLAQMRAEIEQRAAMRIGVALAGIVPQHVDPEHIARLVDVIMTIAFGIAYGPSEGVGWAQPARLSELASCVDAQIDAMVAATSATQDRVCR